MGENSSEQGQRDRSATGRTPEEELLPYRFANDDPPDRIRTVTLPVSPAEFRTLQADGYLVWERMMNSDQVDELRAGLIRVLKSERPEALRSHEIDRPRRFGGLYLRNLMFKDEVFARLLKLEPALSLARSLLGPCVCARPVSARIAALGDETHWHQHLPIAPRALPPWYVRPHSLEGS